MKSSIYKILGVIFVLFIINSSFLIPNCMCQWVQVSYGISNLGVLSLAYNGNNIFAGTRDNGVYLSTDNGTSWAQTPLDDGLVSSLTVIGDNIFAGVGGVYLSTNNGTSWTQTPLNNQFVLSIAGNGNNIFAGTYNNGVYLSTNNGTSWTQTSLNNQDVGSLAVDGNNVYAGTGFDIKQSVFRFGSHYGGVYLSTNNGINWTQTSLINQNISSLTISGNNIFAGGVGVYLSTDNGTSWTHTSLNIPTVYSIAVNGNTNIFAGTQGDGVYLSTDNGISWTQRNEGLGNITVHSFCILNNYIFASGINVYRRPLSELVDIRSISSEIPYSFSLSQNYPNPFNPNTVINYQLAVSGLATLKIYDVLGNEIATLVNEKQNAGTYEVNFDGSNYSSGIYFYKLVANGNIIDTKRMMLLK